MKSLSLILFVLTFNAMANKVMENILAISFKNFDVTKISELRKIVMQSEVEISNLSNPIELRGAIGSTTVGNFNGDYDEIEISYDIELSGQKRKIKSQVMPLMLKIVEFDSLDEINEMKFSIFKLLVLYSVTNERYQHAILRSRKLKKLGEYLKNYKLKTPQSLANKNLISLRIEDLEYELSSLKIEIQSLKNLLNQIFETNKTVLENLNSSPDSNSYFQLYKNVLEIPSRLEDYFESKIQISKIKKDISSRSGVPDLTLYAGQNNQDQYGSQPQVTKYIGIGLKIPFDLHSTKLKNLRNSELQLEQINQRRKLIESKKELSRLMISIEKKINYFTKYDEKSLEKKELELDKFFDSVSKGLIPLQTYLELDTSIHERLHNLLNLKLEILDDFFHFIELKKQPIDVLGGLL